MKCLSITLLSLFFLSSIHCQIEKGIQTLEEAKTITDTILMDLTQDKVSEAFDKLREIWILPAAEITLLEKQTLENFDLIKGRYGKRIGYKYVGKKTVEGVGCQYIYVLKHEKHALRFRITYYQGVGNLWYLNAFTWDDLLPEIIEDQPIITD
ncbi:MAG: hypothetical protein AB8B53_13810 [Flavobacteriales bacterium]